MTIVPIYYLDANVIIYTLEYPVRQSMAQRAFLMALERGHILACTSELSLAECLVGPFLSGNDELVSLYREFLVDRPFFQVLAVDTLILIGAAQLLAKLKGSLPDAIHVATALAAGATTVITNDKRFRVPDGISKLSWDEMLWRPE